MKHINKVSIGSLFLMLIILPLSILRQQADNVFEEISTIPVVVVSKPTDEPTRIDEIEPMIEKGLIILAAPISTLSPTAVPTISATEKVLMVSAAPVPTPLSTNTPEIEPTVPAIPPTIEILQQSPTVILLGGHATPNSTIGVLTNNWTVGVTTADEFGRWEQLIYFPTVATYVIYAQQLDSNGMEIFSSNVMEWQETIVQPVDELPENAVIAVSSSAERCEGVRQIGVLLSVTHYRVGVCQSLSDIGQHLGIYLELLIHANPQIEDPGMIHPGQIINLP